MATTKRVTPGREGYKILFDTNTVIMNKKFAAAAAKYGTRENKLLKDIRTDFPGMTEVIVSTRLTAMILFWFSGCYSTAAPPPRNGILVLSRKGLNKLLKGIPCCSKNIRKRGGFTAKYFPLSSYYPIPHRPKHPVFLLFSVYSVYSCSSLSF